MYSPTSTRLVTLRLDTTCSTYRAHAHWLCRACRTARLDASNVSCRVETSYSAKQVLLNGQQMCCGGARLHCYQLLCVELYTIVEMHGLRITYDKKCTDSPQFYSFFVRINCTSNMEAWIMLRSMTSLRLMHILIDSLYFSRSETLSWILSSSDCILVASLCTEWQWRHSQLPPPYWRYTIL